jgi:hypothetical protein
LAGSEAGGRTASASSEDIRHTETFTKASEEKVATVSSVVSP